MKLFLLKEFRINFLTDYVAVGFDGSDHPAILPIPPTANVSAQSELPICLTFSPLVKMINFSFLYCRCKKKKPGFE